MIHRCPMASTSPTYKNTTACLELGPMRWVSGRLELYAGDLVVLFSAERHFFASASMHGIVWPSDIWPSAIYTAGGPSPITPYIHTFLAQPNIFRPKCFFFHKITASTFWSSSTSPLIQFSSTKRCPCATEDQEVLGSNLAWGLSFFFFFLT